jgi:hypothetical protein
MPTTGSRDTLPTGELYDLVLVDPGPLPPHERTWRHPSELGPTKLDVDTGPKSHLAVLAAGAFAVLAVAAIVVVMTPRPETGPMAISVTTTPARTNAVVAAPRAEAGDTTSVAFGSTRPAAVRASSGMILTTFASYPHAVISAPQRDLDSSDVADEEPDDADMVYLRTEDVTYRLRWELVSMIEVPDGAVVFDDDGDIVARVDDGAVLTLVVD